MEKLIAHTGDPFTFTYAGQTYKAFAECLPSSNSFRRYKINFPNVQSIVEGCVYLNETPANEWAMDKIMNAIGEDSSSIFLRF